MCFVGGGWGGVPGYSSSFINQLIVPAVCSCSYCLKYTHEVNARPSPSCAVMESAADHTLVSQKKGANCPEKPEKLLKKAALCG